MGLPTGVQNEIERRRRIGQGDVRILRDLGLSVLPGARLPASGARLLGSAPSPITVSKPVIRRAVEPGPVRIPEPKLGGALEMGGQNIRFPGLGTTTVPGSIIMPDIWRQISERLLDKFLPLPGVPGLPGVPAFGTQDPVRDLPMVPNIIDRLLSGTLPRGAVAPITGPNGLPDCPRGYHFHKGGQPWCVKNRRMNPLNPRALSRASRRIGGFARAVKRARTIKRVVKNL